MNEIERIKMVKAMEFIAHQIKDDELFNQWREGGVETKDIRYGELEVNSSDESALGYYYNSDRDFAELMHTFLWCMKEAYKSGGLFCDDVESKQ